MIVEGVHFVEEEIRKMKKKEFISLHKKSFFLDRPEFDQEIILSDIYDRIVSKGNPPEKSESII